MTDVPKVLVIDDETSMQKAIAIALKDEGYEIFFADNGKIGLDIFLKEKPELIFLDIMMPVMDGYGFLNSISIGLDSPFTIIVMTGYGAGQDIARCYELGIDFFLKKPLRFKEICGLARRCIKMKRLERERVSLLAEVQEARDELELRVAERTAELSRTITALEREIEQHQNTSKKLEGRTAALQETNIALQVLLRRRDEEKAQYDLEVKGKIEKMIQPYIDKLKETRLSDEQKNVLTLIEQNLGAVVSPFLYNQLMLFTRLTAKEIQVANLIKQGLSSKEIAALLNISTRTVETHRFQIRKKLGLKDNQKNLRQSLLESY